MSEHTAAVAVDAMLVTNLDDDAFGWEMLALLDATDFEYERWCRVMGLDPDFDATFEKFYDLLHRWAGTWVEMDQAFVDQIMPMVEKWRRLLDRKPVF